MVFERKGVISKYYGIRSYDFFVLKVVFFGRVGAILSRYQLSMNTEMILGQHGKARRFGGSLGAPIRKGIVTFGGWDCL